MPDEWRNEQDMRVGVYIKLAASDACGHRMFHVLQQRDL